MITNLYMMQARNGKTYRRSTQERINALIEAGLAEWSGSDYDEGRDAVVHYADWREE